MKWHTGHRSCPNAGRRRKKCDKLRSVAEHPQGIAAATTPYKFLNGDVVAAALVWRIFFYRRLTERDLITAQISDGAKKRGLAASRIGFVNGIGTLPVW